MWSRHRESPLKLPRPESLLGMPVNQLLVGPLGPRQTSAGRGPPRPLIRGRSPRAFIERYLSVFSTGPGSPACPRGRQEVAADKTHLAAPVSPVGRLCPDPRPGLCLGQGRGWPLAGVCTGCVVIEPGESHFQSQGRWRVLRSRANQGPAAPWREGFPCTEVGGAGAVDWSHSFHSWAVEEAGGGRSSGSRGPDTSERGVTEFLWRPRERERNKQGCPFAQVHERQGDERRCLTAKSPHPLLLLSLPLGCHLHLGCPLSLGARVRAPRNPTAFQEPSLITPTQKRRRL